MADPLSLTGITHIPSKSIPAVHKALLDTLRQLRKAGFTVGAILTDREGAVLALREELEDRGIRVNATGAGQHVPIAENKIRQVEERGRCVLSSPLPFKLPRPLIRWLIAFCTQRLNMVQRRTRADAAIPMELFFGRKINFPRDVSIGFGDFVHVIEPIDNPITKASVHQPRTKPAIVLFQTLNQEGSVVFLSLKSFRTITRTKWVALPMPNTAIERLNKLASYYVPVQPALQLKPRPHAPRRAHPRAAPGAASEAPNVALPPTFNRTQMPTLEGAPAPEIGPEPILTQETVVINPDQLRESAPQQPKHRGGTDTRPEVTDTRPEVTDTRPEVTDTRPEVTDTRPEVTDTRPEVTDTRPEVTYTRPEVTAPHNRRTTPEVLVEDTDSDDETPELLDSDAERKRIIPSHMFLKAKYDADNVYEKLKARLVGCGNRQDRTVYGDVSSPTVTTKNAFIIAALAASEKREVATVDIRGAYLNAKMEHVVHMRLEPLLARQLCDMYPEYRRFVNPDGTIIVRLLRALYGCIQSAKLWYEHLCKTLRKMGFKHNPRDHCVFNRGSDLSTQVTICIHVDDLKITSRLPHAVTEVIDELSAAYPDFNVSRGTKHSYLGMMFD